MTSINRNCGILAIVLLALIAVGSQAAPAALAQWPQEQSWTPNRRPIWPAGPKAFRVTNPNWFYGEDEETNPCFIAPGAHRTPEFSRARANPAFLDELFFEFE